GVSRRCREGGETPRSRAASACFTCLWRRSVRSLRPTLALRLLSFIRRCGHLRGGGTPGGCTSHGPDLQTNPLGRPVFTPPCVENLQGVSAGHLTDRAVDVPAADPHRHRPAPPVP